MFTPTDNFLPAAMSPIPFNLLSQIARRLLSVLFLDLNIIFDVRRGEFEAWNLCDSS